MAGNKGKLTDEQRVFVTQALARFDSPQTAADALKKEFGVDMPRQSIEAYDPTKRAGRALGKKLTALFWETRASFLKSTAEIGIANLAVRLQRLDRMAARAEERGNYALAAQLLEQAAKDSGGALTNRREITGRDGRPIQMQPVAGPDLSKLSDAQLDALEQLRGAMVS